MEGLSLEYRVHAAANTLKLQVDDVQVDDMRAFTAFPVLLAKVRADAAPGPAAAAPAPRASKLFAGEFVWRTSEGGRLLEYSKIDAEVCDGGVVIRLHEPLVWRLAAMHSALAERWQACAR
eukprot:1055656-Prorocentrum_minimum.AAC.1